MRWRFFYLFLFFFLYFFSLGGGGEDVAKQWKTWYIHYSNKKLKEHVDIMIFIERYPLKRCQGCVKLIVSKVNCFLNINITDLSEVQLCMPSNSWTWECPHTKDGADHVPLIFLSSVYTRLLEPNLISHTQSMVGQERPHKSGKHSYPYVNVHLTPSLREYQRFCCPP